MPATVGAPIFETVINDKRFILHSDFEPAGDQPEAIRRMIDGVGDGLAHQTLLGVTGSGKTFSVANVIQQVQRPTLVLAPGVNLVDIVIPPDITQVTVRAHDLVDGFGGKEVLVDLTAVSGSNFEVEK